MGQELWLEPYYPNRFAQQLGFDHGVPANVSFTTFSELEAGSIEQLARGLIRAFLSRAMKPASIWDVWTPPMGPIRSWTRQSTWDIFYKAVDPSDYIGWFSTSRSLFM